MKPFFVTAVITLMASQAFAQTPESPGVPAHSTIPREADLSTEVDLSTPTGHEVSAGIASYNYSEPGDQAISIHGPKFVADYTGTLSLSKERHWFAQGNARGTFGSTAYDGWCSPFLITPNSTSPNGYELDTGTASPCNETGDQDWYFEGRALAGKDLIGRHWGWSPYSGVGLRYLSNGISGASGYRTDSYLYLPLGLTARTNVASRGALSLNVEYDHLLHGWQRTRDSDLGGGLVPATDVAPAFTVDGFTDISFTQTQGWALRASAKYPVSSHLWLEPYYVHWQVSSSPVNYETATFTVNGITAQEQLGAYEPDNATNEFGVRFGFRFGGPPHSR
jgi:hypothetical protein